MKNILMLATLLILTTPTVGATKIDYQQNLLEVEKLGHSLDQCDIEHEKELKKLMIMLRIR